MTSSFLRFPQRIINKDHSLSLLDKIVVNRKELFKFQLVQLMIKRAVFASSRTPSEQNFLECAATTAFHSKAISSITISFGSITSNNANITLSNKQITFNDISRLSKSVNYYLRYKLDLFIIDVEQQIYSYVTCRNFTEKLLQ